MKKTYALATLLACTGIMTACSSQRMESSGKTTDKSVALTHQDSEQMVSNVAFKGIDGMTYRLTDFKGKKIYLKFWASWCPICLAGLEELDSLAQAQDEDTVILSVVSPTQEGEHTEAEFKEWYKELGYSHLPVLLDSDGCLIEEFGVRVYPTSVFIKPDGELSTIQPGHMEKNAIQQVLSKMT